jgi:hypothetical protein
MGRATHGHDRERCIRNCMDSARTCYETAMTRCLEEGGEHVEPEHFKLMMNCAALCRTVAEFLLSHSPYAARLCALCANVCLACADSCRAIGGMDPCARACDACAESCKLMSIEATTPQRQPVLTHPQNRP